MDTAHAGMDTAPMQELLAPLATELERVREVSPQVIKHVTATYGVERDAVGGFFEQELSKLEDYEIDLILSPLFTPTIQDQAPVAELLGRDAVARDLWPGLVHQLATRPTCARLRMEDGRIPALLLREVTIERYVHRLRLDATIPEPLFKLIEACASPEPRALLKAVARRAIWQSPPRREILVRLLLAGAGGQMSDLEDVLQLLKLMETYEPNDLPDLIARIPQWEQVLRRDITMAANPKPFFNERVQELHGGGRDQRSQDHARISAKERELAFLTQLRESCLSRRGIA